MVEALATNSSPTNEATLPTFTCRASSNHENIIHEVTKYCSTTNVLPLPPLENYPLYGNYINIVLHLGQTRVMCSN